jgi:hypothetical protein
VQDPSMALDDPTIDAEDVRARLHGLFDQAKETDEFEFGCTLLRVRGIEDAGWDPFVETAHIVEDLMGLSVGPLRVHAKARLGLLLYCHLTEVTAIYSVLGNLTRVVSGERYVLDPFLRAAPKNRKGEPQFLSTPLMVRTLRSMLKETGHKAVADLFDWFFIPGLRNTFAHADYTLHEDKFRSRSEYFEVGGIRTPEIRLEMVADIVNRSLTFYGEFIEEFETQRSSYGSNKIVLGRFAGPEPAPIELLADERRGLYGFREPRGEEP